MRMSPGSQNGVLRRALGPIKSVLSWWNPEAPQYAHPWSAFKPTTCLAGDPPKGIVMATRVHTLFDEHSDAPKAVPAPLPDPTAELIQPPVIMKKIARQPVVDALTAPVLPSLNSSAERKFQLAARLRSVAALNRPVRNFPLVMVSYRAVRETELSRKLLSIQPPDVLRMKRKSAQIIYLDLALAGEQSKQVRARNAA
jgi:hypothetical protein